MWDKAVVEPIEGGWFITIHNDTTGMNFLIGKFSLSEIDSLAVSQGVTHKAILDEVARTNLHGLQDKDAADAERRALAWEVR